MKIQKISNGNRKFIILYSQFDIYLSSYLKEYIKKLILYCIKNNLDIIYFSSFAPIVKKPTNKLAMYRNNLLNNTILYNNIIENFNSIKSDYIINYYIFHTLDYQQFIKYHEAVSYYFFYYNTTDYNFEDIHIETFKKYPNAQFNLISYKTNKIDSISSLNELLKLPIKLDTYFINKEKL